MTCNRLVRLRTAINRDVSDLKIEWGVSPLPSMVWDWFDIGIACDKHNLLLLSMVLVLWVLRVMLLWLLMVNMFRVYVLEVFGDMCLSSVGLLETSWTVSNSTDPFVLALLATVATFLVGASRV